MSGAAFDYGKDALDFVDSLESIDAASDVVAALGRKLREYGFHAFLITGLPHPGGRIDPLVMLNGWPLGWFDLYCHQHYVDNDPIVMHCHKTVEPFIWADVPVDRSANPRAAEVMDRAADFHMVHGYCVPIHGENGFEAVVTMAGDRPDLSRRSRSAIHLVSIYAHARTAALLRNRNKSAPARLSTREREVLSWMAIGKSADEVADILGILGTTVRAHFDNARIKLGTRGRMRTVIEAYRRREIRI